MGAFLIMRYENLMSKFFTRRLRVGATYFAAIIPAVCLILIMVKHAMAPLPITLEQLGVSIGLVVYNMLMCFTYVPDRLWSKVEMAGDEPIRIFYLPILFLAIILVIVYNFVSPIVILLTGLLSFGRWLVSRPKRSGNNKEAEK